MIVSHRHRFIFVKTRKTAGTSIERFLGRLLGPDDIIRGAGRANDTGHWNPLAELARHPDPANVKLTVKQWRRGERFYEHMPAWRIRARLGAERWDDYFSFCFERDPWDKLASFYWWRTRDLDDRPEFPIWVRSTPGLSAWPLYASDDQVQVDFVGRYEQLEEDLTAVLARLGIDEPVHLGHEKSGFRPRDEGHQVSFSPQLDAWVRHTFRREIAMLGYDHRSAA